MTETLAQTWFRRVWNEGDVEAIDELFARDGVARGIHGDVISGPAEFREFHASFRAVFADINIEVIDEIACDDRVAIRCRAQLVHRATEQPVTLLGTVFFTVRDGQIQKAWNHWDFLGLLESMQLQPARSFERASTGELQPHSQAAG